MSGRTVPEGDRELDVRAIDGEPFQDIVAALAELPDDETLVLINSFEPEPLYRVLAERGFEHRTTRGAPDEWYVEIEHA